MDPDTDHSSPDEPLPFGQVIFDEYFLFFMLSLVISFCVYNVWGLLDLVRTPALAP